MIVAAGSTDVTTYFVLRTSADGLEKTAATITDIDLQYVRSGAAPAAKVDATALAATDSAHSDNKAIEVDATDQPGLYRVDWPDAAFAAGVKEVILSVKIATCFTEHLRVELSPAVDTVAISGDTTAADNCELMFDGTGYAGGTTKLKVDVETIKTQAVTCAAGVTILASVGTAATSTAQTGDSYAIINGASGCVAIKTQLADIHDTDLPAVKTDTAAILVDTAVIGAAGAGLTAVPWNAAWDAEVQSECTDALNAYDPPTNAEMEARTLVAATTLTRLPTRLPMLLWSIPRRPTRTWSQRPHQRRV